MEGKLVVAVGNVRFQFYSKTLFCCLLLIHNTWCTPGHIIDKEN